MVIRDIRSGLMFKGPVKQIFCEYKKQACLQNRFAFQGSPESGQSYTRKNENP